MVTGRIRQETLSGTSVVVKRAEQPAQRSALQHEANMLARLQHPGVISVAFTPGTEHDELATAHAGSVMLADFRPAGLGSVAGVLAGVASTLADLHGSGYCHQRLTPDHVIVGAARHPTLCSFSEATPATPDAIATNMEGIAELIDALIPRTVSHTGRVARRQRNALADAAHACRSPVAGDGCRRHRADIGEGPGRRCP